MYQLIKCFQEVRTRHLNDEISIKERYNKWIIEGTKD